MILELPLKFNSSIFASCDEAVALVGTSSMYNRESLNEASQNLDPYAPNHTREFHDGNWTIQGADAGLFNNRHRLGNGH